MAVHCHVKSALGGEQGSNAAFGSLCSPRMTVVQCPWGTGVRVYYRLDVRFVYNRMFSGFVCLLNYVLGEEYADLRV